MSTLGTNYGISELRIAYAIEDAINYYLVDGTMPNEGALYGISEKRLAIAIAENTSISGGGSAAWGAITGNLASQSDLSTALSLKQNSLVSGTNIRTINSTSLLGSGDLAISASPAGTTGQIQFNNAGVFGASSNLVWDDANSVLKLSNGTTTQASYSFINAPTAGMSWNSTTNRLRLQAGTSRQFEFVRSIDGLTKLLELNSAPFSSFSFESSVWVGNGGSGGVVAFGTGAISDSQLARVGVGKLNFQGSQFQPVLAALGINNTNPLAQLDVINSNAAQPVLKLTGASGQSAYLQQWLTSAGTAVASIGAGGNTTITTQNTSAALTINQSGGASFFIDSVSGTTISRFFSSGEYWLQSNGAPVQIRAAGGENAIFYHDGGVQFENRFTNTSRPTVNIATRGTQSAPLLRATGSTAQAGDLMQAWSGSSGTLLASVAKSDGSYGPASLTDAAATNNSLYYSTTQSKLAYKDSVGTVNASSGINTGDQSSITGITGTTAQFNTALTDGDFATLAGTETLTNKVIVRKFSTKTANYTLTNADSFVRFNGINLTATLPDVTTVSGYQFEIKNVNISPLTINTTSSQLIDSGLTVSLIQYEVLKVVSNGTSWDVI